MRRSSRTTGAVAQLATINAEGVTSGADRTLANTTAALPGVTIGLLQEVAPVRLRDRLSPFVGVHQDATREDKAGVALVWDRSRVRAARRRYQLGATPNGHRMLRRWLCVADLTIDGHFTVTAFSGHRPPARYSDLWPEFDRAVDELVETARHPVIGGLDSNTRETLDLATFYGLQRRAIGIDVILASQTLDLGPAMRLPATKSDHPPVGARLFIDHHGGRPR